MSANISCSVSLNATFNRRPKVKRVFEMWKFICPRGHEAEMVSVDNGEYDLFHKLRCACGYNEEIHGVDG